MADRAGEHNLARLAEGSLDRHGDYDSLFFEGRWHSSGSLAETNRLIREATGFRPCDFRPPDGRVDQGLIDRANAEHLMTINWDVDPRDWSDPGVEAIASNVINHARSGSIVVMHDGGGDRSETVEALPKILSYFRHRGYEFVPVTELLGHHFIY